MPQVRILSLGPKQKTVLWTVFLICLVGFEPTLSCSYAGAQRAALGDNHRPLPVAEDGRWFERHGRKIRLQSFMQTDFAGTVTRRRSRGCRFFNEILLQTQKALQCRAFLYTIIFFQLYRPSFSQYILREVHRAVN